MALGIIHQFPPPPSSRQSLRTNSVFIWWLNENWDISVIKCTLWGISLLPTTKQSENPNVKVSVPFVYCLQIVFATEKHLDIFRGGVFCRQDCLEEFSARRKFLGIISFQWGCIFREGRTLRTKDWSNINNCGSSKCKHYFWWVNFKTNPPNWYFLCIRV